MRAVAVGWVGLAACGRVGFERLTSDAAPTIDAAIANDAPSLPVCSADDFTDGLGDGWYDDGGRWSIGAGPTGPMWRTQFGGTTFTYPVPGIPYAEVDFEVDAMIADGGAGDFFLQLINAAGGNYQVTLHPSGSDDPIDTLHRIEQTGAVVLDMAPNRIAGGGTWSRMRLVRAGTVLELVVDGAAHLSAVDAVFGPPYYVDIGFNIGGGAVDNITLRRR